MNTVWTVDYERVFRGANRTPGSRDSHSVLSVNQLRVQPAEGDARGHSFHGLQLQDTGSVVMGEYAHPRDQGGRVSANVSYTTDRALHIQVHNAGRGEAQSIVAQVRAALEEQFVSDPQAQASAALTDEQRQRGVTVTARFAPGRARQVEVTPGAYEAVTHDGQQMNAIIRIPTTTSAVQTQHGGEQEDQAGRAVAREDAETDSESRTLTAQRREQITQQLERTYLARVTQIAAAMVRDATEHRTSSRDEFRLGSESSLGIEAEIPASFNLGGILSRIPLVGNWLASRAPQLSFRITPSLNMSVNGQWTHAFEEADSSSHGEEVRAELQRVFEAGLRQMWSRQVETSLTGSLTRAHSETGTDRSTADTRRREVTRSQTTVTHQIEEAAGQPHLVITGGR